jgi:hypothetical protein
MTNHFFAILLVMVMAMLGVCLAASAADLVSPQLLPPASGLRVVTPNLSAAFDSGNGPSDQPPAKDRHLSKTEKVLAIVGGGLIVGGVAAIVHGQHTTIDCSGSTCADIAWRDTGIGWTVGDAALVIVGMTRHTTD